MKRALILLFILCIIPLAEAQVRDSIYEYLHAVDPNYPIVLGDKGKSSDSIAASELVLGLLDSNHVNLEIKLENEVNPNVNKILIGHPCNNKLIKLSCESWPFEEGEAIVKMIGNDLVIAGTDDEAVIDAAKVLADYRDYRELKEFKYVLINRGTITGLSENFDCGDAVCEDGEKYFCPLDCEQTDCMGKCRELGFSDSRCTQEVISTRRLSCSDDELEIGNGFCTSNEICCCVGLDSTRNATRIVEPKEPVIIPKEKSYNVKKVVTENIGVIVVFFVLIVIVTVLVIIYKKISV